MIPSDFSVGDRVVYTSLDKTRTRTYRGAVSHIGTRAVTVRLDKHEGADMYAPDELEIIGSFIDLVREDVSLDSLVREAIDAMFVPIAAAYPEIKTGDFSPEQEAVLQHAVRKAIIAWVANNS